MLRILIAGLVITLASFVVLADDSKAIKLTPEEYAAEVKKDEKAAAKKYKGATIELTQTVTGVQRNASGDIFVSLPAKSAGILGVSCFLKDKKVIGKVVKGQEVTIRGRYPDFQFGAQLMDCEIAKLGPSPALTYTAEDFAKEYAKDKDAAEKKWKDKTIIVTGLVVETKSNDVGAINIFLKAGDKARVDCGFTAFEKDLAGKITPGEKVKLVGEFLDFESTDNQPAIRFCLPASD
jgi:hypothetical protein